jgi:hypothetical protein
MRAAEKEARQGPAFTAWARGRAELNHMNHATSFALGMLLAGISATPSEARDMKVVMTVIPHQKQRYDTVGDWHFTSKGDLKITVSKLSDPRYETLIAVHELVEGCAASTSRRQGERRGSLRYGL